MVVLIGNVGNVNVLVISGGPWVVVVLVCVDVLLIAGLASNGSAVELDFCVKSETQIINDKTSDDSFNYMHK